MSVEYFLCVEGLGWPTDISDLTQGFSGTVFATGDLNGDLATVLGCTVKLGLNLPRGISEQMDPRTLEYSSGSMSFSVLDVDDFLQTNVRPHAEGKTGKLNTDTGNLAGTIRIDNATTTFDSGETIWVGGREAMRLNSKSLVSGTVYQYGVTRNYLGTPRGRKSKSPFGSGSFRAGFTWKQNTVITQYNRYWFDRRVLLFTHVPGETVGNVDRLYTGRLRTIKLADQGIVYQLGTTSETVDKNHTTYTPPGELVVANVEDVGDTQLINLPGTSVDSPVLDNELNTRNTVRMVSRFKITVQPKDGGSDIYTHFQAAFAYNYRRAAGGTEGALNQAFAAGDPERPQAVASAGHLFPIFSVIKIGSMFTRAMGDTTICRPDFNSFQCAKAAYDLGVGRITELPQVGDPVIFGLDNTVDDIKTNRFTVNNAITKNPIDVLLCFLTTMPTEFVVEDTSGSPGTTTTINFASTIGTANQWVGYALHATEDSNIGEARVIVSNTTTSITVDVPFSNTPTAAKEYQVRNSIYDVLPIGWGLGIPNEEIDISSFETVRNTYLTEASLGNFALTLDKELDLWELLKENVAIPFNIFLFQKRTTGKLSCEYVAEVVSNFTATTLPTISSNEILDLSPIDLVPRSSVSHIAIETRNANQRYISAGGGVVTQYRTGTNPFVDNKHEHTITIRSDELDNVFDDSILGSLKFSAKLNDTNSIADLSARMISRLRREARPAPEVEISLDISRFKTLQVGQLIKVTDTDTFKPFNPYSGTRGFNSVVCRIISLNMELEGTPRMRLKLQILNEANTALIAPACVVTAYSSGTFTIDVSQFAQEGGESWDSLFVNDRLELRDKNGALKGSTYVISSFGANTSPLPSGASTDTINITTSPSLTIATGDYLTFAPYSGSNTTNMDQYAAYADSTTELLTGGDAAKEFV